MELVLIKKDSSEWNFMWEWLAKHPINEGLTEPSVAENENQAWQYMGSYKQDNRVVHNLRHRNHPKTNRIERLSLDASPNFTPDQIEVSKKLHI